jgi:hypothetical protein
VEVLSATRENAPGPQNGGFPEPSLGLEVRLVKAFHDACDQSTLIRLPLNVLPTAIRQVTCSGCGQSFKCDPVEELGVLRSSVRAPRVAPEPLAPDAAPAPVAKPRVSMPSFSLPSVSLPSFSMPKLPSFSMPKLPTLPKLPKLSKPTARTRTSAKTTTLPPYASVAIAFAAVVIGIIAIQSWNSSSTQTPAAAAPPAAAAATQKPAKPHANTPPAKGAASGSAKLIRGSNYTLALPAGWKQTTPIKGATFAAAATDGSADATLWIQNDPSLDYPTFEARSLAQLRAVAGSARVASRVVAPTADGTVVHLTTDAPASKPAYQATLRVFGPYRYYLATTVEPNGSSIGTKGAQLLANSLTPINDGTSK